MSELLTTINDLHLIHFTLEALLAVLAWVLFRRLDAARRRIGALETAQGLMKRRSEAATAGLHSRLLHVERQLKQPLASPPGSLGAGKRTNGAESLKPSGAMVARTQLSRGEFDLLMKVRQLNGARQ